MNTGCIHEHFDAVYTETYIPSVKREIFCVDKEKAEQMLGAFVSILTPYTRKHTSRL